MEKLESTNVSFATYNMKCPFDVAQSIVDDVKHRGKDFNYVHDLITWQLFGLGVYTEFGYKFVRAFDILWSDGGAATNTGIGQKNVDFYSEYITWLQLNSLDTTRALTFYIKMYKNNPELEFKHDVNCGVVSKKRR